MTEDKTKPTTPPDTTTPTPPKTTITATAKKKKKPAAIALPKDLTIKLDCIDLSEDWNREKLGDISGLEAAIKDEGQLIPLVVRPAEKAGRVILVDGRRRFAAMQKLKMPTAKIVYSRAKNKGKAFLHSMIANMNKKDISSWEKAVSFNKLAAEYGLTNEKIAMACDCSPGHVSQHLAVFKADKKLQNALKTGNIALVMFRHFARLDQTVDKEFYEKMSELALGGMSAQNIEDKIGAYIEKKTEKAVKDAAKSGKSPVAKAKKKGAAAHKRGKSIPKLDLPDYRNAKISSSIKMVSKKDAVDWLDTYRDKALGATTARKREYYQGVLMGMEILSGLVTEE